MADPFGTGAGIIGVIGLAIQITQVLVQFRADWKDVPDNVKAFTAELGTLKTVLSETNTNILLNPEFAEAFQGRSSLLLSQLGPNAPSGTETKLLLDICHRELEALLIDLKKRGQGHRLGWERLKGAFLAKDTQNAVENLCRHCRAMNGMLSIDAAVMGARTYKEIRDARREQQNSSSAIQIGVDQSNQWQENQDRQAILDWLTTIDYAAQQSDFIGRRQPGTGQWLLDSEAFQDWLTNKGQTLFCPGIPGAGKTILTSIVVEELTPGFVAEKNIGIAYIYCNFRRQHEQKIEDLLASLLKQLAQGLPSLPEAIRSLHDGHRDKRTRPTLYELSRALELVASTFSRTFLIIDALDECQVSDGCQKRFLSELFDVQAKCEVSLFATSRFIPEITRKFQECHSLEIRASQSDVRKYVENHMSRLPSFVERNADLREEVKITIIEAVDGMFLLAQLHIDSLIGKRSPKAVRTALKSLPSGTDVYDHAYKDAMIRIEGQVTDQVELAKQVLSCITCAQRPLTTAELQHALAVEIGASKLDEDNMSEIEDLVSVCAGLVTVDEESNVIRLIHYTTQEYFERTKSHWFPIAESDITAICVAYLSFDVFALGFCGSDKKYQNRLMTNPFFEYSTGHWGYHALRALSVSPFTPELDQAILNFLTNHANADASAQGLIATVRRRRGSRQTYSQRVPKRVTGYHLAAYFGLDTILKKLIEIGKLGIDAKDTDGQTALSWAAENGHAAVLRILLETGATDASSIDNQGKTPLIWAALNGHDAAVKLLLDTGKVDPDQGDKHNRTPLLWGARKGHETVVRLLLQTGKINISARDTTHNLTPLSWAAQNKHEAVVRLLLETGCVDVADVSLMSMRSNHQLNRDEFLKIV